jgi:hypothetical protein
VLSQDVQVLNGTIVLLLALMNPVGIYASVLLLGSHLRVRILYRFDLLFLFGRPPVYCSRLGLEPRLVVDGYECSSLLLDLLDFVAMED